MVDESAYTYYILHFRQWAKKEWLRFYILHSTFLDFTFWTTSYILHLRLRVFVETTYYILHIRFQAGHLHSSSTFAGRRSKPSCIYILHLESQQHAGKFIYILHSRPGLHTPGFGGNSGCNSRLVCMFPGGNVRHDVGSCPSPEGTRSRCGCIDTGK